MLDTKRKIAIGVVVAMFGVIWFANRLAVKNITANEIPSSDNWVVELNDDGTSSQSTDTVQSFDDGNPSVNQRNTVSARDGQPATEALNIER